jgi:hypothetical protein
VEPPTTCAVGQFLSRHLPAHSVGSVRDLFACLAKYIATCAADSTFGRAAARIWTTTSACRVYPAPSPMLTMRSMDARRQHRGRHMPARLLPVPRQQQHRQRQRVCLNGSVPAQPLYRDQQHEQRQEQSHDTNTSASNGHVRRVRLRRMPGGLLPTDRRGCVPKAIQRCGPATWCMTG